MTSEEKELYKFHLRYDPEGTVIATRAGLAARARKEARQIGTELAAEIGEFVFDEFLTLAFPDGPGDTTRRLRK